MRKTLIILFAFLSLKAFGQDSVKNWKFVGLVNLNYGQTRFKYWVVGGNDIDNYAFLTKIGVNYEKNIVSWSNNFEMAYGMQKVKNSPFRKSDDRLEYATIFGLKMVKNLNIGVMFNFKTQLTDGYDYLKTGDSVLNSTFLSPAYLSLSLGIDYKPSDYMSAFLSPLSAKMTYIMNDSLAAKGVFGVEAGKHHRFEMGASFKMNYTKKLMDNFLVSTKLLLFSNYLHNPQNIDVDFGFLANYKLWKNISLTFETQLVYDDDVLVLVDENTGAKGKRLQIKRIMGVGLSYTFDSSKNK